MQGLRGKKGLIVGVANEASIAWGCARSFREAGAELAVTYLNEKAEPYVRPLAEKLNSQIIMPLEVQKDSQMQALFATIKQKWGRLDFLLHAIAFTPKEDLHGRVTDCSREGFLNSMDISCYSLINMARLAEPLMVNGGSILTTTFYGSEKVVENYGVMGPVKAALEGVVKYLAAEMGGRRIRINALSPGPIATRAASGLRDFDVTMQHARQISPIGETISIVDVGDYARFLVSDESRLVTGNVVYVDAGFNIMAP